MSEFFALYRGMCCRLCTQSLCNLVKLVGRRVMPRNPTSCACILNSLLHECAQVAAVDTNGAGDTFATAYMLALARHARSPGADANWVASRAVMHEQACKPQCVLEGIVLGSSYAQYRQWLRGQVQLQF